MIVGAEQLRDGRPSAGADPQSTALILGRALHAPWNEGTRVINRNFAQAARTLRPVRVMSLTHVSFRAGPTTDWGKDLAAKLLTGREDDFGGWVNHPLPDADEQKNPWVVQRRPSSDGDTSSPFLTSFPLGESLTGASARSRYNFERPIPPLM